MPVRSDPFPRIAAKYAASPDVARLFEELGQRATTFARMQHEFTEAIRQHRAAREGRPVRLSPGKARALKEFDRDADQAAREWDQLAATMDDTALLAAVWSGALQWISMDERMLPTFHPDDQPMAAQLLEYQRETSRKIQQFVESSAFKGRVTPDAR